jgi:hypothetical protein
MRYAILGLVALGLAGCNTFEDDAQRAYSRTSAFSFPAAFTTADARIVTERVNPLTHQTVVCTEPSPDVAKAISTAFGVSGNGSKAGEGVGLAASGASAEAVAELAGRSTALLGLRDGLFQACQAYANGAIGADMYALVVSRYSQLMTTLFLGQDIAAVPQPVAAVASPSVTVNATAPSGGSGTSSASASTGTGSAASIAGTAPTPPAGAANALVRMNEDYLNLDYNAIHTLTIACMNHHDPTTAMPADRRNAWLSPICERLANLLSTPDGLQKAAALAINLRKNDVLARPVDPTATGSSATPKAAAPAANKSAAKPAAKCVTMTNAQTTTVVKALTKTGDLQSDPFGPSNNLAKAIETFQGNESPKIADAGCPKGQIGQETLTALTVIAATPALTASPKPKQEGAGGTQPTVSTDTPKEGAKPPGEDKPK